MRFPQTLEGGKSEGTMGLLEIAKMGEPVLLKVAAPVTEPQAPEILRLIDDMIETMLAAGGAGLAAPQVHRSLRLFVYRVPESRVEDPQMALPPRVLINPVLTPIGDEEMECVEGCLSLPGLRGRVPRFARVHYSGLDWQGTPEEGVASGFHANVLQHEQDHLDGVLYTMRMRDFRSFGYADVMSGQAAAT